MQYILSEEEYRALGPKKLIEKYKNDAKELAKMVAANIPKDGHIIPCKKGYCSECPAVDLCPDDNKEWPK